MTLQISSFFVIIYGTIAPFLRWEGIQELPFKFISFYEITSFGRYALLISFIIFSIIAFNYSYKKIAIIIMLFFISFFTSFLWGNISNFILNNEYNSFSIFIKNGDFSFLGHGWYFILLGLLALLISFIYKEKTL